jgi:preprotein translocase subunit SecE
VATQLGAARYVMFGWAAAWLIGAYVAAKTLQGVWSWLARKEWFGRTVPSLAALPHEGELWSRATISLGLGAVVAAVIVFVYYRKPDVRQWADEVAEQLGKVKWPTRKDVGNYTVVVLVVSTVLTVYLALLDRFWGFLTNLIYSSGA